MINENEKYLGDYLKDPELREQFDQRAKECIDEIH